MRCFPRVTNHTGQAEKNLLGPAGLVNRTSKPKVAGSTFGFKHLITIVHIFKHLITIVHIYTAGYSPSILSSQVDTWKSGSNGSSGMFTAFP